jgi:hypothetical protein
MLKRLAALVIDGERLACARQRPPILLSRYE